MSTNINRIHQIVDVREFDFTLPADLIAQEPIPDRTAARLLVVDRSTGALAHSTITVLPEFLRAGDVLVINNTRVFPARLLGHRVPSGGAVECLLVRRVGTDPGRTRDGVDSVPVTNPGMFVTGTESTPSPLQTAPTPSPPEIWEALMHPGQKLPPGARVTFDGDPLIHGDVLERHFFGRRLIRLWTDDGSSLDAAIDAIGHVPLPPYIKRDDRTADRDRYQTVFARKRGSVAAPTAGLHFTPALLGALQHRGVEIVEITLHVGYGTFQPVRVDRVEDHRVEAEHYAIEPSVADAINRARDGGRRVIAVGTTSTRTVEADARRHDGRIAAGSGTTDLFIYPGFEFRIIDGLLTNFHMPRSSLLMLVSAFGGRALIRKAYDAAVAARYRFYSYGDAMLIL